MYSKPQTVTNTQKHREPTKEGFEMKCTVLLLLSVMLAACASNSGVVQMGNDTYFISKQAATGFTGLESLRGDALRSARD